MSFFVARKWKRCEKRYGETKLQTVKNTLAQKIVSFAAHSNCRNTVCNCERQATERLLYRCSAWELWTARDRRFSNKFISLFISIVSTLCSLHITWRWPAVGTITRFNCATRILAERKLEQSKHYHDNLSLSLSFHFCHLESKHLCLSPCHDQQRPQQ